MSVTMQSEGDTKRSHERPDREGRRTDHRTRSLRTTGWSTCGSLRLRSDHL